MERINTKRIRTVAFQKDLGDDWEYGFLLDDDTIVNMNGEIPKTVWDYHGSDFYANITLDFRGGSVQITCTPEAI